MASGDARPVPQKNVAYRVTFPIIDADGDLVTGATGLDSEVSKDGGTFADCTSEATEIATSSGMYYLDLTNTEMNADTVAIIVKTTSVGAKTTPLVLYPEEAGDIRVNVTQISDDTTAADNCELMFDGTGYAGGTAKLGVDVVAISGDTTSANNLEAYTDGTTPMPVNVTQISGDSGAADNLETAADGGSYNLGGGGVVAASVTGAAGSVTGNVGGNVVGSVASVTAGVTIADGAITAAKIGADAFTAAKFHADVTTEFQSGLATAAALATVDTVVDAIQVTTDKLDDTLEDDGGTYRFTANALEEAPTGGSAPSAADIADAVWDEATAGHTTSGTFGEQLKTDVDAILADTNELQTDWVDGGRLDLILDARASQTSVNTIDDFLDTEIAAILADTNELQTDWADGGRLDLILDARASQTSVNTIDDLIDTEVAAIKTVVDAVQVTTDKLDDTLEDDGGTYRFTTNALEQSPAGSAPTAGQIADAVWDEATAGHTTSGTFGEQLKTDVDAILADTNELQTDWVDGGRLDLILDARASQTSVNTIDDFLDTEIAAILADTNELQTDLTDGGRLDLLIDAIKAKTDNLPSDPADASVVAGLIAAVETKVDTIDDLLDTEVAAIKAKTDNLPSDPADASDIAGAFATLNTKVDAIDDFLDTEIAAIKAKTDNLPASPAAVGSAMTLTSGERSSVADALLDRDMSTGADNGTETVRTPRQALRFLRNKWSISGTTLTVTKENDTDASWTSTVTTNASADPITAVDPASS